MMYENMLKRYSYDRKKVLKHLKRYTLYKRLLMLNGAVFIAAAIFTSAAIPDWGMASNVFGVVAGVIFTIFSGLNIYLALSCKAIFRYIQKLQKDHESVIVSGIRGEQAVTEPPSKTIPSKKVSGQKPNTDVRSTPSIKPLHEIATSEIDDVKDILTKPRNVNKLSKPRNLRIRQVTVEKI